MSGANLAPSSSVKKATAIGWRVAMPCCSRVSITSSPAEDPEVAVEPATRGHRVDVRPGHHGCGGRVGPGAGRDDVADRIDADVEAEVPHPTDHEVAPLAGRHR